MGAHVGVVRVVDELEPSAVPVVHQWVTGRAHGASDAARVLDSYDVAIVQHEFGIFGGPDGADVLDVVSTLTVPVVSVLHTVLTHPTANQHRVMAEPVRGLVRPRHDDRDAPVTPADPRVGHIAGASRRSSPTAPRTTVPSGRPGADPGGQERDPTILTWGLLGEGKGIEWALAGPGRASRRRPAPLYQVVGQTHPRVLERDGEAYRERLVALARDLELLSSVRFDARYLPGPALRAIVRDADVVLLPYDSSEQVTSGVLTEAVAAGKPVVSTAFPHAVELLSGGAGLLVPQRDPLALAAALRRVLTEDGLAERMAATALRARAIAALAGRRRRSTWRWAGPCEASASRTVA